MTRSSDPAVHVSVIVCTRDRPDDLARCLPTILASDYESFEVIVVDQSSDHLSESLIGELRFAMVRTNRSTPRLIYRRMRARGLSLARNKGIAHARGAIVAFTDDDCTVPPDWVRRCADVMRTEPDAAMSFGALVPGAHDARTAFMPRFVPAAYRRLRGGAVRVNHIGVGGNMVVRRSVFKRLGGFDPWLGAGAALRSSEDSDFAYRLLRTELVVIQDPANKVIHWGARNYGSGAARQLVANYHYGIAACYARHAVRGDWLAAYLLMQEALITAFEIVRNAGRRRGPLGFRRLWYLILGAIQGPKWPLQAPAVVGPLECAFVRVSDAV